MIRLYKTVTALFFILLFIACKQNNRSANSGEKQSTASVAVSDSAAPQSPQPLPEDNNIYAEVDLSPMDMSYFPPKYPQLKMAGSVKAPPVMRVIYSRPHLQGRKLFEGIIKYGQNWRLGANEATELNLFQPVTIGDKKLPVGRYTIYAIPKAGYWTIVINNDLDIWGLKQETSMDLVKVEVPVTYYNPVMEYFTMVFEKTATGANLIIAWDDVMAKLPIKF